MQYELFNLERLATTPTAGESYTPELDRIKKAFMEVFVGSEPEEAVGRYVRMHQAGILHLASERSTKVDGVLDELSAFLERHVPGYLDADAPLPPFRQKRFLTQIREALPQAKERLHASGADERLSEILLGLLQESSRDETLTYRQWFPLKDLLTFIGQLPAKEAPGISECLVERLYRLNFNTTTVYRYIKASVLEGMTDKEPASELGRMRRYIGWLEPRPGYQFVEGRASLIRMLLGWLDERALGNGEESADDSGFGLDSKKVITSLTVNELGLLVRLFMETGVFRTRNRKGLARFMAQNVVTLKKEATDEVSSNHLYGTLYSVTDATMDSVQAILNRMLVRLGKLRLEQRQKKPEKGKK